MAKKQRRVNLLAKVKEKNPALTSEEKIRVLDAQRKINEILHQCEVLENTRDSYKKSVNPAEAMRTLDEMTALLANLKASIRNV